MGFNQTCFCSSKATLNGILKIVFGSIPCLLTYCILLFECGIFFFFGLFFWKSADTNDCWIMYVQTIQWQLLGAVSSKLSFSVLLWCKLTSCTTRTALPLARWLSSQVICTQWLFYGELGGGWSPPANLALPHPLVLCLDDTKFHLCPHI